MRGRIGRTVLAAALWAAAGLVPRALGAQDVGLPVGAVPEAVVIEDLDGQPVDLGEVIGKKPVLLEFWATWCPLCAALEPRLEEARRRYGDRVEFLVVAVAVNQSKRSIGRHLERHPAPAFRLIRGMSDKIVELQKRLQEAGAFDAHDRGLRFLADLAEHIGERRGGAIHIRLPLTHQDIASAIGTSRETVSRMLNRLKRDGILEARRSGIVIRDPEALRREIGEAVERDLPE